MSRRYADLDDLTRDLDSEGYSDSLSGGGLDDEDVALLGSLSPDRPRRALTTAAPKRAPRKKTATKKAA